MFFYAKPFTLTTLQLLSSQQDDAAHECRRHWQRYHYLALVVDRHTRSELKSFLASMRGMPSKEFQNGRRDKVVIYTVRQRRGYFEY